MQQITLNSYTHVTSCPVFGDDKIERGTCARCKKNILGDFIQNTSYVYISYCLV